MEVEIISREYIKPSSPTPSHLRNLTLSFLDQKFAPFIIPVLLFYEVSEGSIPLDMSRLKICLSETLTTFYPLAGRYQTWGTILCNDEGIPFVEAQVNCPLSDVLSSISSSTINLISFYPPNKDDLIASRVQLAIQVNVFTCGGFAIGWYHTHKVTDNISAATFFRHWAALVTHRCEDTAQAQPDFNAGVTAFPPVPEQDQKPVTPALKNNKPEKQVLVRSFLFKKQAVTELKAKSISDRVPNPTRFESVSGFLWKQLLLASRKVDRSVFSLTIDLRTRSDPPLPNVSMGNLIEIAWATVEKQAELPELVAEIHETISKMKDIVSEYRGEKREAARETYRQNFMEAIFECKGKNVYGLTSWCNAAGFGDVDFGFGKPKWIVPIDGILDKILRNAIVLTDYTDEDGDGFEAWMFFEEESIKFLETSDEFLAFASPNFKLDNASIC
ncbi:stemmadenine O-acetyltransferase-like [Silene latifolia]|uniref:stemmadenine O-acetyltransferase-like n=1 Tax=Silene latifolia TaxID=37657 RepID=UPI003D779BC8